MRKQDLKAECLAYIEEVWTDMRPLSLRKKMEEALSPYPPPSRARTLAITRLVPRRAGDSRWCSLHLMPGAGPPVAGEVLLRRTDLRRSKCGDAYAAGEPVGGRLRSRPQVRSSVSSLVNACEARLNAPSRRSIVGMVPRKSCMARRSDESDA